jgi:tetratricopeptide (TPR) repeat protein
MNHIENTVENSYVMAQELALSGRYAEAIEAYSSTIAHDPAYIKAYCGRGMAFQQIGEHLKAIADFDKIISCCPVWSGAFAAYYGRAGGRLGTGSFEAWGQAALRQYPARRAVGTRPARQGRVPVQPISSPQGGMTITAIASDFA